MSDSLAIAAVSGTLQYVLTAELNTIGDTQVGNFKVTIWPPDKVLAQSTNLDSVLNLFLYQVAPNAAWRNMDLPSQTRPGETGQPPLALDLHYLMTAYHLAGDDLAAHRLLGHAMRILNDHAVLGPSEIQTALPQSNLYDQVERVRLSPITHSIEDLSKLWTAFQTNYRVSSAFEASVVLIESQRPTRVALPVLTRGPVDPVTHREQGVVVQASMLSPYATLTDLALPHAQVAAQLGDTLTLTGYHLDGVSVQARLTNVRRGETQLLTPTTSTPTQMTVQLPMAATWPATWAPGVYSIAAVVKPNAIEDARVSNDMTFSLAPTISTITKGAATLSGGTYSLAITLTFEPAVWSGQRVALLVGNQEFFAALPMTPPTSATTLAFAMSGVAAGPYYLRLRVDGVDSLLVDTSQTPPVYDTTKEVTIP
jgi:hypothetical protein